MGAATRIEGNANEAMIHVPSTPANVINQTTVREVFMPFSCVSSRVPCHNGHLRKTRQPHPSAAIRNPL